MCSGPVDLEFALAFEDVGPPGLVVDVPVDGLGEGGLEVDGGGPSELRLDLLRIDQVAAVVIRPVGHVLDPLRRLTIEYSEDTVDDVEVRHFVACADVEDR